ncbi:MAG: hypothetical protein HQM04_18280, partial [Magnetococcales bacterium]|nr:hypothetical protein [Magnetococcales bacterium]
MEECHRNLASGPFDPVCRQCPHPFRRPGGQGGVQIIGRASCRDVMMGLATDGGLLLPDAIPQVTPDHLR